MNKTNFEKVGEFNKSFEVVENTKPQINIITKEKKTILQRLSLIQEEFNELKQAIERETTNQPIYTSDGIKRENGNFVEVVDALTDMLYVIHGFGRYIGVNLDESFDIVHKSNMSKLCNSEEEAQQTVKWYKHKYEFENGVYDTPSYRKSLDNKYWIVYNVSTNKILKSINYKPATPDLEKMI